VAVVPDDVHDGCRDRIEELEAKLREIMRAGHKPDCGGEDSDSCACGFKQVGGYAVLEAKLREVEAERDRLRALPETAPFETAEELAAEVRALVSERDALRGALVRIANDGCGFSAPNVPCYESERGEDDWCWCCIAHVALEGGDRGDRS
jgi:hypothetical protein